MIFGDIVLIVTSKPNVLQKIYNHLEKADGDGDQSKIVDLSLLFILQLIFLQLERTNKGQIERIMTIIIMVMNRKKEYDVNRL